MFSTQLIVPTKSTLGQRIPLIQHLVATAVVTSVLKMPGYEVSPKFPQKLLFFTGYEYFLENLKIIGTKVKRAIFN